MGKAEWQRCWSDPLWVIAEETESYNLEISHSALKCEVILRMEQWLV